MYKGLVHVMGKVNLFCIACLDVFLRNKWCQVYSMQVDDVEVVLCILMLKGCRPHVMSLRTSIIYRKPDAFCFASRTIYSWVHHWQYITFRLNYGPASVSFSSYSSRQVFLPIVAHWLLSYVERRERKCKCSDNLVLPVDYYMTTCVMWDMFFLNMDEDLVLSFISLLCSVFCWAYELAVTFVGQYKLCTCWQSL